MTARFVDVEVAGIVECTTDSVSYAMDKYRDCAGAVIRPTNERKTIGAVRTGIKALRSDGQRWWSIG